MVCYEELTQKLMRAKPVESKLLNRFVTKVVYYHGTSTFIPTGIQDTDEG